ncbi:MAG: hypothetical protein HYT78_19900, partial [Deltaproteobacteria bacterium]|nr:hypothetical protein [Deltaproteobacteria bacterium]
MGAKVRLCVAFGVVFFLFGVSTPIPIFAQDFYKRKTIRFVVGFAAGGGYDLAARVVSRHMQEASRFLDGEAENVNR